MTDTKPRTLYLVDTETLVNLHEHKWVTSALQCEAAVKEGYARFALRTFEGRMQPVIELTEAGREVLHKRQVERSTKIPEMG